LSYGTFTKVYTCSLSLLGKWETPDGLFTVDATDLLIIGQIIQFTEKKKKCYLTDTTLAKNTGNIDKSAIQKRLRKLERLEIIQRQTFTGIINGKKISRRELSVLKLSRDNNQQGTPNLTGKEAVLQFLREEYQVSHIPDHIKDKLETVYSGEYLLEKYYANDRPVNPDELLALFRYVFYELRLKERIKTKEEKEGLMGLAQFDYDLTSVFNHYNSFIDKGFSVYSNE